MNNSISEKEARSFSIPELEKYLRFIGFSRTNEKKNTVEYEKYFNEYNELVKIPVPKASNIINYYESVFNVFSMLKSLLNLNHKDLISSIVQVSNDTIKLRLLNLHDYSRSIPLDIAYNEISALKKLLIYGASSEERPRPFFDKPTTIGKNHGNYCQFGHTFEGSFGFTINSPISEDYTQLTFEEEPTISPPFERRVIERVVNGLINTEIAVKERSTDPLVDNFEFGLNSRMCDAIVEMSNEHLNQLQFDISWSPQISTKEEYKNINGIFIKPEAIEIIKDASVKMKTIEPFQDSIIGKIITLHSSKSPFSGEDFPRTAFIKHFFENRPIEVKLELSQEQYRKAYDAHGKGIPIKVEGKIFRRGNTWRMYEIESIEFIHL
jgi:hypothetical protein